jgi:uncharacterized membrane protein (DUF4010 family)
MPPARTELMVDLTQFRIFAEALGLGLLVGIERYKDRSPGEKKSAGVRTFAIFALLGSVCGLVDQVAVTAVTVGGIAALLLLSYFRYPEESVGLTTEFAAILVFWVGYLLHSHETLAISLGIVLTIFLASKRALHDFVREKISETELYATLKFLAVVLVVYPILPDRVYGPFAFFNPRVVWGLVVLVSTVSYVGYFLIRFLDGSRGLNLAALTGGLVSTTAVTVWLAERARTDPTSSRVFGAAAVVANAVQAPRLLLLIWVVSGSLGQRLTIPLLGMTAAGLAGAWLTTPRPRQDTAVDLHLQNPYSVLPALKFGGFFVLVLFVVQGANEWLGEQGVYLATALAGFASASAAALSVSGLVNTAAIEPTTGAVAVLLAVATNALTKWTLSLVSGTPQMTFWLGGGLLTILLTGAALLAFRVFVPA